MNEHIAATISHLKERRQKLDEAIDLLERLYPTTPSTENGHGNAPCKPAHQRVPIGRKINARKATPSLKAGGGLAACVPMVRGLKEPFKTADVERVCKVEKKKAANFITQLKGKGWVESTGEFGQFRRTKDFGGIQLADIHAEIAASKPKTEDR